MTPRDAPLTFGPDGRFELHALERRLLVDGQPAAIGARAFDLLVELASRPGALRTKNELIEAVWPGLVVEEGNLATQISTLRKILGGDVIATIPGHGYRFTARLADGAIAPPAGAGAAGAPAAAPAPRGPQTNLPPSLTPLLGRDDDAAALAALIDQHRLVTVVGAGGMGKTLLAQHLLTARRDAYPHGVCWVALAQVTCTDALPAAIAAAFGVPAGGADALAGLCAAVAPLTMLVALDNAEQVADGLAPVVEALHHAAPGLRLLVTSQVPLRLAAERVFRLGALAVPPGPLPAAEACAFGAVALFAERARQADARFALTDGNAPAVIDLCRQLDGLALAIELAAARAPMLGVQQLAASMHERLRLLGAGPRRSAPARQQTLRAALEWSHGFLDDTERTVFRRMAVLAGSGSLALVQQIVADEALDVWAVLDALMLLVDRSLVQVDPAGDGEPRYRLLETPRLFALERLREAGEEAALRQRHAQAFAAHFDAAWDDLWSGEVGIDAWREAIAPDVDNGWQAYAWACTHGERTAALRVAATLPQAARFASHRALVELCDRCEPWLHDAADADLHARVARGMAGILDRVSLDRRERLLAGALQRLAGSADTPRTRWLRYALLTRQAIAQCRLGQRDAAQAALDEALRCEDAAWPPQRLVLAPEAASTLATAAGRHADALRHLKRATALLQAAGGSASLAAAQLVKLQLAAGDAAGAAAAGRALVAALAGGRFPMVLTVARLHLAAACLALGDTAQARAALQAAWPHAPVVALGFAVADGLVLLAALESRPRTAALLAGHADAAHAAVGPRDALDAAAIARAQALARAALGDAEFAQLHAEGRLLTDAQVAAVAFASDDL